MKKVKHPKDISVRVITREIEDGVISSSSETSSVPLSEKLNDYLLRLGYTNAHVIGIVTQLLTQEKVRVDFRDHSERLELVNPADRLTTLDAVSLLNDYIQELSGGKPVQGTKFTQNITVQPFKPIRES